MASLLSNPKPIPQIIAAQEAQRKARGKKKPIKLKRPPIQRIPKTAERNYRSALLKIVDRARGLVRQLLIPRLRELANEATVTDSARRDVDDWPDKAARIMEQIRFNFEGADQATEAAANVMGSEVNTINQERIQNQAKQVLGVDVIAAAPALEPILKAAVKENVALIKTLSADYFEQIEGAVMRGFRTGQRADTVAADIAKLGSKARQRAAFIARDQVLKLNGNLTRDRQQNLGLRTYIWRTSLDERVRPDHAALEGTVHSWKGPGPITDKRTGRRNHPGQDFNCRCTAEPNIDQLLGEETPAAKGTVQPEAVAKPKPKPKPQPRRETATERTARLRSELEESRKRTEAARRSLETQQKRTARTQKRLSETQEQAKKAARENRVLAKQVETTKAELERVKKLNRELDLANERMGRTQSRIAKLRAETDRVKEQTKKARAANKPLRDRVAKLEKELAQANKENRALDLANTRLERRRGSEG